MSQFSKMFRTSVFFSILFSSAAITSPAHAQSSWCEGWTVGADALFWKPLGTGIDFANEVDFVFDEFIVLAVDDVKAHYLCPNSSTGVRYFAGKDNVFCGWNLGGSYTHFNSSKSKSLYANGSDEGETLFRSNLVGLGVVVLEEAFDLPVAGLPTYGAVDAKQSLDYKTFDVLVSHDYSLNSCHSFRPFFGVEGAKIEQSFKGRYDGFLLPPIVFFEQEPILFEPTVDWKSEFRGIGLKLGTEYEYQLNHCLAFVTNFSGSLLAGKTKATNNQFVQDESGFNDEEQELEFMFVVPPLKYHSKQDCVIVPGAHIDLALHYNQSWCGFDFGVSVGYEFLWWYNLPKIHRFESSISNSTSFEFEEVAVGRVVNNRVNDLDGGSLGIHGWHVGFNVSF